MVRSNRQADLALEAVSGFQLCTFFHRAHVGKGAELARKLVKEGTRKPDRQAAHCCGTALLLSCVPRAPRPLLRVKPLGSETTTAATATTELSLTVTVTPLHCIETPGEQLSSVKQTTRAWLPEELSGVEATYAAGPRHGLDRDGTGQ